MDLIICNNTLIHLYTSKRKERKISDTGNKEKERNSEDQVKLIFTTLKRNEGYNFFSRSLSGDSYYHRNRENIYGK